jgi:aminopeptidase N
LSEAWAQYASALWVRHKKGEEAFFEMLERMASWARRHDDMGPVHLGQRLGHLKRDRRIRRALVYDKGALVLHMLRQIVGDEAFFGSARSFLERHRYTTATTEDLRAALEEASGRDLEAHFEHWIYGTGVPTLEWASRSQQTPDGFETTVQVRPEGLPAPLPLEIAVTTSRNREVRRVVLEPGGGSWTIASPDPVRGVRINENLGILAEEKEVRRLKRPPQR